MMEGEAELTQKKLKSKLDEKRKAKGDGRVKLHLLINEQRDLKDKYKDQIDEIDTRIR